MGVTEGHAPGPLREDTSDVSGLAAGLASLVLGSWARGIGKEAGASMSPACYACCLAPKHPLLPALLLALTLSASSWHCPGPHFLPVPILHHSQLSEVERS